MSRQNRVTLPARTRMCILWGHNYASAGRHSTGDSLRSAYSMSLARRWAKRADAGYFASRAVSRCRSMAGNDLEKLTLPRSGKGRRMLNGRRRKRDRP